MEIIKSFIKHNRTPKKRTKKDIKYIVIHYVGALGDAAANIKYYGDGDRGASADFFVGHGGDVRQAVDYWNYYSWHCGGKRQSSNGGAFFGKCTNANSVGIEMCVKKKSIETMNSTDKDWYFTDATVKSTIELVRHLMKELDIDADHVIRHYDVNGKTCPNPYVYNHTKHTWQDFKKAISQNTPSDAPDRPTEPSSGWYRVRIAWNRPETQKGAFRDLELAKRCARSNPGHYVYDDNGKILFPVSSFLVKVTADALNIRKGPGANYGIAGVIKDKGVYTIVREERGWGRLLSGKGWISLKYTKRV